MKIYFQCCFYFQMLKSLEDEINDYEELCGRKDDSMTKVFLFFHPSQCFRHLAHQAFMTLKN